MSEPVIQHCAQVKTQCYESPLWPYLNCTRVGNSLASQSLGLHTLATKGPGLIPHLESKLIGMAKKKKCTRVSRIGYTFSWMVKTHRNQIEKKESIFHAEGVALAKLSVNQFSHNVEKYAMRYIRGAPKEEQAFNKWVKQMAENQ